MLRIGSTTTQLVSRHNLEALVPDVLFYENEQVGALTQCRSALSLSVFVHTVNLLTLRRHCYLAVFP